MKNTEYNEKTTSNLIRKDQPMNNGIEDTNNSKSLGSAPDGGWGWVVVICAFLCFIITDGIMYSFGLFYVELIEHFDARKGKVAIVGALLHGMSLCFGVFASFMVNMWGLRVVSFIGSIVAALAFACSIFAPSLEVFAFVFGFMGGSGIAMIYLPINIVVGFYFDKKRSLANGITSSGTGLGAFIFSPFCNYLIQEYTWKGAILILSGVLLQCLVFCASFRPLKAATYVTKVEKVDLDNGAIIEEVTEQDAQSDKTSKIVKSYSLHFASHISNNLCDKSESVPNIKDTSSTKSPEYKRQLLRNVQIQACPKIHQSHDNLCNSYKQLSCNGSYIHSDAGPMPKKNVSDVISLSSSYIYPTERHHSPSFATKHIYLKPLEKKDIFYSGSLHNIPTQNIGNGAIDRRVKEEGGNKKGGVKSWKESIANMSGIYLLTNPIFLLIVVYSVLWITHATVMMILPHYSILRGHSSANAAVLLSIIGIANTLARIFAGWLSNFEKVSSVWISAVALLTAGVTCISIAFTQNYIALCIEASLFGSCMATTISLRPIVIVDLLGLNHLTNAFGLLTVFQGVALTLGPPIAGALYDVTGSYTLPFILAGIAISISGIVCVLMKKIHTYRRRHRIATHA